VNVVQDSADAEREVAASEKLLAHTSSKRWRRAST
jgi:hypothetical protein